MTDIPCDGKDGITLHHTTSRRGLRLPSCQNGRFSARIWLKSLPHKQLQTKNNTKISAKNQKYFTTNVSSLLTRAYKYGIMLIAKEGEPLLAFVLFRRKLNKGDSRGKSKN